MGLKQYFPESSTDCGSTYLEVTLIIQNSAGFLTEELIGLLCENVLLNLKGKLWSQAAPKLYGEHVCAEYLLQWCSKEKHLKT